MSKRNIIIVCNLIPILGAIWIGSNFLKTLAVVNVSILAIYALVPSKEE